MRTRASLRPLGGPITKRTNELSSVSLKLIAALWPGRNCAMSASLFCIERAAGMVDSIGRLNALAWLANRKPLVKKQTAEHIVAKNTNAPTDSTRRWTAAGLKP